MHRRRSSFILRAEHGTYDPLRESAVLPAENRFESQRLLRFCERTVCSILEACENREQPASLPVAQQGTLAVKPDLVRDVLQKFGLPQTKASTAKGIGDALFQSVKAISD